MEDLIKDDLQVTGASPARARRLRLMRASACVLALTMAASVLGAGIARAADDDDGEDDTPFTQKVIRNVMSGIGAVDPSRPSGIEYRERSPLVVPPKLDLPPPEKNRTNPANWPKDPDVQARKEMREANRREYRWDENRSLNPSELNAGGRAKVRASTAAQDPGKPYDGARSLNPSELNAKGNIFTKLWDKTKSEETAEFKGEPTRENLTQPPAGYQTPSPSYAYGLTSPPKSEPTQGLMMSPSQLR